jgi:enoyl-CoA hydratase
MNAASDIVITRPAERVMQLGLHRPEARNALRTQTLLELAQALANAADDAAIGAVVITGDERYFAAGADIREMAGLGPIDVLTHQRGKLWQSIAAFPKPLVAAVNGYALGAGCELALCADIVVAGEGARFGQPEINLGIIPGAGGTQRLTRVVGKPLAMKMILTGEPIDAAAALAAGLVAEVVATERVVERALAIASVIAAKPALAVRLAKEAVQRAYELPLSEGLNAERKSFALLASSHDRNEGIAAFLEKRPPRFEGR